MSTWRLLARKLYKAIKPEINRGPGSGWVSSLGLVAARGGVMHQQCALPEPVWCWGQPADRGATRHSSL